MFSRPFNEWEVEDVERLLKELGQLMLVDGSEDRVKWNLTTNGNFEVRLLYQTLRMDTEIPYHGG